MNTSALNVNWQGIADQLYTNSVETIHRFASEHAEEVCSFFAYDVDLPFCLLSFDTPANALQIAQRTEQEAIAERAKMLTGRAAWRGAQYFSSTPLVLDFSYATDYFAYHRFSEIKIDEVEDLEFAEDYPEEPAADDYAEGNMRIVLWRVIERLIESGELDHLRLASPCRLGYQMHGDRDITVLRILNWPHLA